MKLGELFPELTPPPAPAPAARTTEIWADSLSRPRPCRGTDCTKTIVFAQRVSNGRAFPLLHPITVLSTHDAETPGRRILHVVDTNHFIDCVERRRFRRKR